MEKKTIGSFISVLRKANGMTQRELAEKLNVSDKAVSRWERDEAMPDLTLIPVLADIFGVTADELLRGQRATAEAAAPQAEEKSKKQLKYLLEKTRTDYRIRTLICLMLAVLGLIAAAILNLGFLRAVAGFWVGCIFFVGAAVAQTVFKIQLDARLNTEEFDPELLAQAKKDFLRRTMVSYSLMAVLFAFTLPLAFYVTDIYLGIRFDTWFWTGLACAAVTGILALLVCLFIWQKKTGQAAKARLLKKTLVILIAVFVLTALFQTVLLSVLDSNRHWFGTGTKYDSFEEFVAVIETPPHDLTLLEEKTRDGVPYIRTYGYREGNYSETQYFYAVNCRWQGQERWYFPVNEKITYISFESDAIYTYTSDQSRRIRDTIDNILACTMLLYPMEIIAAAVLYRRKAKALL